MCDSVVATGGRTRSGLTVSGKNRDRKAGECQLFVLFGLSSSSTLQLGGLYSHFGPSGAETYRVMGHSPWCFLGEGGEHGGSTG